MPLRFRPIDPDDIPTLHRWRNQPHVAQWWTPQNPSLTLARDEYTSYMQPNYGVDAYIIVRDERDIGYMQKWTVGRFPDYKPYLPLNDHEVGIDVFIGEPDLLHQGIGTQAIRQFIRNHVFSNPAVPACIIDPLPENTAAIRAYSKVGFIHEKTFQHEGKGVYLMRLRRAMFDRMRT